MAKRQRKITIERIQYYIQRDIAVLNRAFDRHFSDKKLVVADMNKSWCTVQWDSGLEDGLEFAGGSLEYVEARLFNLRQDLSIILETALM